MWEDGQFLRPFREAQRPAGWSVLGLSQLGSSNWSGYAQGAANGTYQSVVDTWKVPIVKPGVSGKQFSSDWVGIGGLNDGTLVQAGTEADNSNGDCLLPSLDRGTTGSRRSVSLVVHPGDTIKTSVVFSSTTKTWTMTVKDLTTGLKGKRTASKKAVGSSEGSVEAMHERPCIADGCTSVNDLANLTKTDNVSRPRRIRDVDQAEDTPDAPGAGSDCRPDTSWSTTPIPRSSRRPRTPTATTTASRWPTAARSLLRLRAEWFRPGVRCPMSTTGAISLRCGLVRRNGSTLCTQGSVGTRIPSQGLRRIRLSLL